MAQLQETPTLEQTLHITGPGDFDRELRLAAAAKWYELGLISQGRAAEMCQISRAEFLDALVKYQVSPFHIFPKSVSQEALDDQEMGG